MNISILLLCIKICLCRILDVTCATIRTVVVVKGKSKLAACIGFLETFIWFMMVREALNFETASLAENVTIAIAYGLGFSTGTFIGATISKDIGGLIQVQVISSSKNDKLVEKIQDEGYALTVIKTEPTKFSEGKYMLLAEMKSSKLKTFRKLVSNMDEKAFITVTESKYAYNGFIK